VIRRHSLVWLQSGFSLGFPDADAWRDGSNAFIVCRTRPGESLSLGYCVPATDGAKPPRHAVAASAAQIAKITRPPVWEQAVETLGFTVRLIGSRMWARLTGNPYGRPDSDVDLVVDLDSPTAADAAVEFLTRAAAESPVAIDAELSFPDIGEIHWKEWQSTSPQLLVKSVETARLVARADLQ